MTTINELMGMLNQTAPYTPEQERSIDALIESQKEATAAIRAQLTQTPISHRVSETQHQGARQVIVQVERESGVGEASVGTVRGINGRWQGRGIDDGYWRLPIHDSQSDAVLDVLTEHIQRLRRRDA